MALRLVGLVFGDDFFELGFDARGILLVGRGLKILIRKSIT